MKKEKLILQPGFVVNKNIVAKAIFSSIQLSTNIKENPKSHPFNSNSISIFSFLSKILYICVFILVLSSQSEMSLQTARIFGPVSSARKIRQ